MKINKNSTFVSLLEEQGKENEISRKFKELTLSKIEPNINIKTGEITFSLPTGDSSSISNIKISRGEESIFIWSVFLILIESIISELNNGEISNRSTDKFDQINYIYIDDPVSSLDDNYIIDVAIDLKRLIVSSKCEDLRFVISTHHAFFYNILLNEFKRDGNVKKKEFYSLTRCENEYLFEKTGDSPFGYHLLVKQEIQRAIDENKIEKYHYALFRNLLEKTATYLGYTNWSSLLLGEGVSDSNRENYVRRINAYSHNKYSELDYKELTQAEKNMLILLFKNFIKEFRWEEKIE